MKRQQTQAEYFREHIRNIYKILDEKEGTSINREFFKKTMEIQEQMEREQQQRQDLIIEKQIEKQLPQAIEKSIEKIFSNFR